MSFLPFKTVYRCAKGQSTNYTELAGLYKRLTLNRDVAYKRFQKNLLTPFKQITIVPYEQVLDDDYRELMEVRHWDVFEGRASLLGRIKDTLKATIAEHWVPGGVHAMLHSSGYDSRCISWLIKELAEERGGDWLGTVVFCCSRWEAPSFRAIMEYQGWEPRQYFVPGEGRRDIEYYAPSLLGFKRAWLWSDGASPLPINLYWYPVHEAIEADLLPSFESIQVWTGRWGNTVLDAAAGKAGVRAVDKSTRMFYNSTLCQRPTYDEDTVDPYATTELATVVCSSSLTLGEKLRPFFCEYLDSKLATFDNLAADGDRHRRIAGHIVAKMEADYQASWYGKTIHPEVRIAHKTTEFQDFYYHWTLASFCEDLRSRGISIR